MQKFRLHLKNRFVIISIPQNKEGDMLKLNARIHYKGGLINYEYKNIGKFKQP